MLTVADDDVDTLSFVMSFPLPVIVWPLSPVNGNESGKMYVPAAILTFPDASWASNCIASLESVSSHWSNSKSVVIQKAATLFAALFSANNCKSYTVAAVALKEVFILPMCVPMCWTSLVKTIPSTWDLVLDVSVY